MRNYHAICLFMAVVISHFSYGQTVQSITFLPSNPATTDTVLLVSNFSFYGNCDEGLVYAAVNIFDTTITILPEYCGYGDSSLCHAIDTFTIGLLAAGNYNVDLEYHQGTVCGGSFDIIIANLDTTFQVATPSSSTKIPTNAKISIYPNPTSDILEIKSAESIKKITLFDINGKISKIIINSNFIDMHDLNPGLYILHIQLSNSTIITKAAIRI